MKFDANQPVKWVSHIGKVRYGTYVTHLLSRPDFVHIKGADGKAHIMRQSKPTPYKKSKDTTTTREREE